MRWSVNVTGVSRSTAVATHASALPQPAELLWSSSCRYNMRVVCNYTESTCAVNSFSQPFIHIAKRPRSPYTNYT